MAVYEIGAITQPVDEVIRMYKGRRLDELTGVPLSEWEPHELSQHHFSLSQLTPWLNAQGVSLHHQLIEEIERRGGLSMAAVDRDMEEKHPAADGESHDEHRFHY